ncbi:MAG: hypothetical protein BroJett011_46580 [Chloroflexota bacterium]|nr:MAG: hypothetical protein BroJett011_46580 [Chloroflexota bacterium]
MPTARPKGIFVAPQADREFLAVRALGSGGVERQGRVGKYQIMLGEVIEFKKKNATVPL